MISILIRTNKFQLLRILFCVVSSISFSGDVNAQLGDSIKTSFTKFPMPYFSFESSNSFVDGKGAWINGYKVGVSFNGRMNFGVGWYKMLSDIVENKSVTLESGNDTVVPSQLEMSYWATSASLVYYQNQKWILSAALQFGLGKSYFDYFKSYGESARVYSHNIVLTEIGTGVQYKIVKWVGLSGGLGFRIMLKDNPEIDRNFNTLNYYLGVRVYLDEIYKSVFPKGIHLK